MLWANAVLKGHIDASTIILRDKPFTAMNELADLRESVGTGKVSLFRWIKDFCSCDVGFTYNKNDKAPFFYEVKDMVVRVFKRTLHL